jgi:hypothetical protein
MLFFVHRCIPPYCTVSYTCTNLIIPNAVHAFIRSIVPSTQPAELPPLSVCAHLSPLYLRAPSSSTLHLPPRTTFPHPPFRLLPPMFILQIPLLHTLKFLCNLLALIRYAMRLPRFRPEFWDRESAVQVCAEVVHYADWEENVHAELCGRKLVYEVVERGSKGGGGRTLKTSRFGPAMFAEGYVGALRGVAIWVWASAGGVMM